jgi:hypothetical protein
MLASREIWMEHNAGVFFWKVSTMPTVVAARIEEEAALKRGRCNAFGCVNAARVIHLCPELGLVL